MADHKLTVHAKYSTLERVKACSLLEPYISNILEQVDAALAIICMESKIRRLKEIEHFKIPTLMPSTCTIENNIQVETYCHAVDNEVKTIFEEMYKLEGVRLSEERRRRQQPLLPTTSQEVTTHVPQPSFTIAEIQTRTTNTPSMPQPDRHQEVTPQQITSADIVPPYSRGPWV